MGHPSVLIADDELSVRITLEEILSQQGFEVTSTASVREALCAMNSHSYDVLISDLNIGQPGDGFTLISAMRRQQPDALTVLITGFPDFESALEAIRNQVDEYLIKPAEPARLVSLLQDRISGRIPVHTPRTTKCAVEIIRDNLQSIIDEWLQRMGTSHELACVTLPKPELLGPIVSRLTELLLMLELPTKTQVFDLIAASRLGRIRQHQGYTPDMLAEEARLLENAIFDCLETNLLKIDTSHLIHDLVRITDTSRIQLKASLKASAMPFHAKPGPR
jgi:ActR/RegA family two-component response regulator